MAFKKKPEGTERLKDYIFLTRNIKQKSYN